MTAAKPEKGIPRKPMRQQLRKRKIIKTNKRMKKVLA
jgi:hypothetical protein